MGGRGKDLKYGLLKYIMCLLVSLSFTQSDQNLGHILLNPQTLLNVQNQIPYVIECSAHFFIENDAEILRAHYTWKVTFTNLIH